MHIMFTAVPLGVCSKAQRWGLFVWPLQHQIKWSSSLFLSPLDTVESLRFLGTITSKNLTWKQYFSSIIEKAQQRMYFL